MISSKYVCGLGHSKGLMETQMHICWQMCLEGSEYESLAAFRTKHQVSNTLKFGRECCQNLTTPESVHLVIQEATSSRGIMAGNTNAKYQYSAISSAWWWSHICPHALQKVLSGGFLVRQEPPLQNNKY